jgi:hypothetical protein
VLPAYWQQNIPSNLAYIGPGADALLGIGNFDAAGSFPPTGWSLGYGVGVTVAGSIDATTYPTGYTNSAKITLSGNTSTLSYSFTTLATTGTYNLIANQPVTVTFFMKTDTVALQSAFAKLSASGGALFCPQMAQSITSSWTSTAYSVTCTALTTGAAYLSLGVAVPLGTTSGHVWLQGITMNPAGGATNSIPFLESWNTTSSMSVVNNAVVVTNVGGVPSESTTLPAVSGAALTALPTNTALYPILNQSTSGNAATASSAANFSGSLSGDVTGTQSSTSVVKVNGGSVPASVNWLGTNSSGQPIQSTNSLWIGYGYTVGTANATTYICFPSASFGDLLCDSASTNFTPIPIATPMTVKACYVYATCASGTCSTMNLLKYHAGTSTSTPICTLTTGASILTCSNTSMSVSFAAGDGYGLSVLTGQATDVTKNIRVACSIQ